MSTTGKENLEERIERIRRRNEEIEKKHREAEEDRLMALKENAMVKTKPPKDEDWPKAHKYDTIDFTYDVKPEKLEELQNHAKKHEEPKSKRDHKKFADGEGPPPDPAYNFLADAERDGNAPHRNDCKSNDKKDHKQVGNKTGNRDYQQQQQQRRGGPNSNSFRGRGGKNQPSNPKYQKQNSQPEYDQWRNEREKIDEARINRQKSGEGKWRREWDSDKFNSETVADGSAKHDAGGPKKSPHHGPKYQTSAGHNSMPADCLIEKRGNITVSVTQTGEVKSVKLTSAPVIGTGRVGPRQVGKPQFSIQTVDKEHKVVSDVAPKMPYNKNNVINNHLNNIKNNNTVIPTVNNRPNLVSTNVAAVVPSAAANQIQPKHKRKQNAPKYIPPLTAVAKGQSATPIIKQSEPNAVVKSPTSPIANLSEPILAQLPSPTSANDIIVPVDLSHKPEFAKKSVQDRLARARKMPITPPGANLPANSPLDSELAQNSSSTMIEEPVPTLSQPNNSDTCEPAVEAINDNCSSKDEKELVTSMEQQGATFDDSKTKSCDTENESIQAATPIAACN